MYAIVTNNYLDRHLKAPYYLCKYEYICMYMYVMYIGVCMYVCIMWIGSDAQGK